MTPPMPSPPTPHLPSGLSFRSAALTDTGKVRDTNEDYLTALPNHGVFAVADGVGGLAAGEVASQHVCTTIKERLEAETTAPRTNSQLQGDLEYAVTEANRWIIDEATAREVKGMATTLALLFFDPEATDRATALHAGDSRVYRLRGDTFEQITNDHSIAGQLGVDENQLHPMMQGVITRAVGILPDLVLEQTILDVAPGDLFLVCSDGLTRMIPDQLLKDYLAPTGSSLDEIARHLINEANRFGGHDNISLILVRVLPKKPQR